MSANHHAVIFLVLVLVCSSSAQVASVVPKGHYSANPINLVTVTRVEVSHNTPAAIRRELLDTNTIVFIAASTGLTSKELAALAVAPGPVEEELWFYQTGASERAAKLFGEKLHFYVWGRLGGHTKGFLLSALTNSSPVQSAEPDLRALLSRRPELPAGLLKRSDFDSKTNRLGEIYRTTRYYYVDGEVAWCYDLTFSEDGKLLGDAEWRVDASEYDPKFQEAVREVDRVLSREMQRNGTNRPSGPIRSFSEIKKERLRAKGIPYRSFEELNPGIVF